MGGAERAFPSTHWSQILSVQDPADPAHRDLLSALLQTYWKPVYAYVRLAWRKSNEDAKDLTQSFFTHLLQNGGIVRLRPDGGRFRGFLKRALKNYLIDADRAAAIRRPVDAAFSLEAHADAIDRWGPAAPGETPDRAFDREWLSCMMEASVAKLERNLADEGKEIYFKVFRCYLLDPACAAEAAPAWRRPAGASTNSTLHLAQGEIPILTYAEVAAKFGLSESDVRNYLNFGRARLREIVKAEIRAYVETDGEVEEELNSLLRE